MLAGRWRRSVLNYCKGCGGSGDKPTTSRRNATQYRINSDRELNRLRLVIYASRLLTQEETRLSASLPKNGFRPCGAASLQVLEGADDCSAGPQAVFIGEVGVHKNNLAIHHGEFRLNIADLIWRNGQIVFVESGQARQLARLQGPELIWFEHVFRGVNGRQFQRRDLVEPLLRSPYFALEVLPRHVNLQVLPDPSAAVGFIGHQDAALDHAANRNDEIIRDGGIEGSLDRGGIQNIFGRAAKHDTQLCGPLEILGVHITAVVKGPVPGGIRTILLLYLLHDTQKVAHRAVAPN